MSTYLNLRSTLDTDPIRNFRFLATFSPTTTWAGANVPTFGATLGFTQISGLTVTTESIPYREGGYNTNVHQIPGQTSFSPITFTRGMTFGSQQNWSWMKRLFDIAGATTATNAGFRCTIDLKVLKHPATQINDEATYANFDSDVAMRFRIYNAWITSVAYSDLNAGDNALMVEQMSVVHEGFEMVLAKDAATAADALNLV